MRLLFVCWHKSSKMCLFSYFKLFPHAKGNRKTLAKNWENKIEHHINSSSCESGTTTTWERLLDPGDWQAVWIFILNFPVFSDRKISISLAEFLGWKVQKIIQHEIDFFYKNPLHIKTWFGYCPVLRKMYGHHRIFFFENRQAGLFYTASMMVGCTKHLHVMEKTPLLSYQNRRQQRASKLRAGKKGDLINYLHLPFSIFCRLQKAHISLVYEYDLSFAAFHSSWHGAKMVCSSYLSAPL